jgi:succinate dehydrogenase/fumarate reductase flavoprotein subunit
MQRRVIVVGAAVAGSAVANAFGQAGIPTPVLEKGAERRPAAAIEANHWQSLRIWPPNPHDDPEAYARALNPSFGWGARGAGWGQNPAALAEVGPSGHR